MAIQLIADLEFSLFANLEDTLELRRADAVAELERVEAER